MIEFASALRKGLGRPAVVLQERPGDHGLNAELLKACMTDLRYDSQVDQTRADYLHRLILMSHDPRAFRVPIEARLQSMTDADRYGDAEQVFGILCRLTASDAMLRHFVLTTEYRKLGLCCVDELVRFQGVGALLACVHRFSREMMEEPWIVIGMTSALEQHYGDRLVAAEALLQARRADALLDRLLALNEVQAERHEVHSVAKDYAVLKAELDQGALQRFPYSWTKGASQEEIERVAGDLVTEANEARVGIYLTAFRRRDFPGDPVALFPWLERGDYRTQFRTATVLGRLRHPAVRALAVRLLAEGRCEIGAQLLRGNYEPGDAALLTEVLDKLPDDEEEYHGVGLSALHAIKSTAETATDRIALLMHIYEHGPCSCCRGTAVDLLAATGDIPDWMPREARYDAEPSVAGHFRV